MGKTLFLAAGSTAASGSGSTGSYTFLLVIVVLFGLFWFLLIRPQRNRQRQVQQMQRDIVPGSRVRTTAGMYATVTAVEGDDVTLEVAPGVQIRFLRRAIMDVLPDGDGMPNPDMAGSAASDMAEPGAAGSADTGPKED